MYTIITPKAVGKGPHQLDLNPLLIDHMKNLDQILMTYKLDFTISIRLTASQNTTQRKFILEPRPLQ